MIDLVAVIGLTIWAAGVGLAVLDRLIVRPEHPSDTLALAVPLGLGILSLSAVVLGEIGQLHRAGFIAVFVIGIAMIFAMRVRFPRQNRAWNPWRWAFDLPLVAALIGTLLTALAPVTDGDALCYHLQVPKVFLQQGAMAFEPDLHETIYPLVTEMLYAVGLAFRGPIACRLLQWVLGVCFAANVTAMARPILGDRARWAGTIALLVPAVSNGMSASLNDVALAAYCNAALATFFAWKKRPAIGSATLAGAMAGLAIGVKYPALIWVGLLGFSMMIAARNVPKRALGHALAYTIAVIVVGGCWYLRAFHHTGNPVYPFFRSAFGGSGIDDVLDPIKRPMAVSAWNLLTALVPMTLQPDRFDSFSHQFGPAFLLMAPAVILFRMPGRLREIAAIGFAYLTICLTQRQSMRFVLAAIGPFSIVAAWAAASWADRRTWPARGVAAILMMVLAFEAAIAVGRVRNGLSVVMGRETAEAFLRRREPSYRVGRWIDANLPPEANILGQEHRGFYIPRPYTMELAHRRRTGLGSRGESGDEIAGKLRDRGFTHLLLCPPEPETAVEFDPKLSRAMETWLSRRSPIFEDAITDPDGVTRRYRIYELDYVSKLAKRPAS